LPLNVPCPFFVAEVLELDDAGILQPTTKGPIPIYVASHDALSIAGLDQAS
jgi:hypothetical protein